MGSLGLRSGRFEISLERALSTELRVSFLAYFVRGLKEMHVLVSNLVFLVSTLSDSPKICSIYKLIQCQIPYWTMK